jgi:hypothetical protein
MCGRYTVTVGPEELTDPVAAIVALYAQCFGSEWTPRVHLTADRLIS